MSEPTTSAAPAPGPANRWRIDEVADRLELSVDTIRFYQKRRLVPPPVREGRIAWYGPEHVERLVRIRELQGDGFSLAVIRRLVDGELDAADAPLAAAVADVRDDDGSGPEEFLDLAELAARSGVPLPLVEAVEREGLLVPRLHDGVPRYTNADVEIVAAGLRLLEAGFPLPDLLALARDHHGATRDIAQSAVTMFDEHVRAPLRDSDLDADARAEQLVDAFRVLLPAVTALVAHHFRRTLLQVAQEHLEAVGEPAELAAAGEEAARAFEQGWRP
ncbi:MAG: MerR family transcriptional regulator [Actinomycetes bacterium]